MNKKGDLDMLTGIIIIIVVIVIIITVVALWQSGMMADFADDIQRLKRAFS